MKLEDRYRELREKLFVLTVFRKASDGEWETQEQEDARESENKKRKSAWDAETEAHIRGEQ
jgi:hypothetical protein